MTDRETLAREDLAKIIRGALVENWSCYETASKWDEDVLLTGCKKVGNGQGYQNPEQAAQNLALDAADAILSALRASTEGGEETSGDLKDVKQRLLDGIADYEKDQADGWERGERPDLWDHVVEVPVADAKKILAVLSSSPSIRDQVIEECARAVRFNRERSAQAFKNGASTDTDDFLMNLDHLEAAIRSLIWLEPKAKEYAPEGRMWCQDDVWEDGVRYVRADFISSQAEEIERITKERDEARIWHEKAHTFLEERNAYKHRAEAAESSLSSMTERCKELEEALNAIRREADKSKRLARRKVKQALAEQDEECAAYSNARLDEAIEMNAVIARALSQTTKEGTDAALSQKE